MGHKYENFLVCLGIIEPDVNNSRGRDRSRFGGKVWCAFRICDQLFDKFLVFAICSLTIATAAMAFHGYMTKQSVDGYFHAIVSIGLPFFFLIKNRDMRGATISFLMTTLFLRMGWIGFGCAFLTFVIMCWKDYKALRMVFIVGILVVLVLPNVFRGLHTPIRDSGERVSFYKQALWSWQHPWRGDGIGSFEKIPENQPVLMIGNKIYYKALNSNLPYLTEEEMAMKVRVVKKWLSVVHSDLLQGFIELGILIMFPIIFILAIPLCYLGFDTDRSSAILASYSTVLLQSCIDFPFHRDRTSVLCLIIIIIAFKETWKKKVSSHTF